MANPNLGAISGIYGKNAGNTAITTSLTTVLETPANRVYKINTLLISNTHASNSASVKAALYDGSSTITIVDNVEIPFGTSFTAIDRTIPVYLEEGELLQVSSNTGNEVHVLVSYEDIG